MRIYWIFRLIVFNHCHQLGDGSKNVPVGKTIALLAEEGDDISNLDVPEETTSPGPQKGDKPSPPASETSPPLATPVSTAQSKSEHLHKLPVHNRPLFPSVQRLVLENHLSTDDLKKISGTGVRGMLTKGDILAHIGRASSPWGTSKSPKDEQEPLDSVSKPAPEKVRILCEGEHSGSHSFSSKVFDAETVRHIIVAGLRKAGSSSSTSKLISKWINRSPSIVLMPLLAPVTFSDIIDDYLPQSNPTVTSSPGPPPSKSSVSSYFEGLI